MYIGQAYTQSIKTLCAWEELQTRIALPIGYDTKL